MQASIRKFVTDYGEKGAPYPTTLELTQYLREAAGPDYDQLITDYWDRITFWTMDVKSTDEPSVKPNAAGGYDVTVQLKLDKLIASEEDGKESSVAEMDGEGLNEWIEIGLYTADLGVGRIEPYLNPFIQALAVHFGNGGFFAVFFGGDQFIEF